GHPTYALTVIVFLMLLSSGIGSFASRRWLSQTSSVRVPLVAIAAGIIAYVFILPAALSAWIGQPFFAKLCISGLFLIPLGFAMGMPFPPALAPPANLTALPGGWPGPRTAPATVPASVSRMF